MPFSLIKEVIKALKDVLTIPIYLMLFAIDMIVLIPLGLAILLPTYRLLGLLILITIQSPIIYLVIKEAYRRSRLPPPLHEGWEVSSKKWNKALEDYIKMVKKRKR